MPPSIGHQEEPIFLAEEAETPAREDKPRRARQRGAQSEKRSRSDPIRLKRSEILVTTVGFFFLGGLAAAALLALYLLTRGSSP